MLRFGMTESDHVTWGNEMEGQQNGIKKINRSSECEDAEGRDRDDTKRGEGEPSNDQRADKNLHQTWYGYVEDDAVVVNEWRTVRAESISAARKCIERDVITRSMEKGVAPDFTIHVIIPEKEHDDE